MTDIFDDDAAFEPFLEPVKWRGDRAPHRVGVFGATVLHASPDATNAGHPLGSVTADPWVVHVSQHTALAAAIGVGDTLTRTASDAALTVQQVSRDDSGWLFICSANERPQE